MVYVSRSYFKCDKGFSVDNEQFFWGAAIFSVIKIVLSFCITFGLEEPLYT